MLDIAPAALSAKEAARYLNVSVSKLYDLANAGDLPKMKLGHRSVFRRRDLDALLDRGTTTQRRNKKPVRPVAIDVFG